ncbi:MAG: hypothetical protein KDD44_05695, partial [Bdellovibrionales bacterium]|nr:hypothetical protein [Bdellovibrionales bacterium]
DTARVGREPRCRPPHARGRWGSLLLSTLTSVTLLQKGSKVDNQKNGAAHLVSADASDSVVRRFSRNGIAVHCRNWSPTQCTSELLKRVSK